MKDKHDNSTKDLFGEDAVKKSVGGKVKRPSKKPTRKEIERENERLVIENERLELMNASYRADILERTTEFVDQQQAIFGVVDYLHDSKEIRTLGESRRKWDLFKEVLNETQSHKEALDAIGVELVITHNENRDIVLDAWAESKDQSDAS